MGDLNLPNVDWDSGSTRPGCSKNDRDCLTRLGKLMEDHFLIQSVDVPTRKENILDVILTNGNDIVKKLAQRTQSCLTIRSLCVILGIESGLTR